MKTTPTTCPKCRNAMEQGFMLNYQGPGLWCEGEPERTFFGVLKMIARRKRTTLSFRCEFCGYVETYASDLSSTPPRKNRREAA